MKSFWQFYEYISTQQTPTDPKASVTSQASTQNLGMARVEDQIYNKILPQMTDEERPWADIVLKNAKLRDMFYDEIIKKNYQISPAELTSNLRNLIPQAKTMQNYTYQGQPPGYQNQNQQNQGTAPVQGQTNQQQSPWLTQSQQAQQTSPWMLQNKTQMAQSTMPQKSVR